MLDRYGYRPNVGVILLNDKNEVFFGRRVRSNSWQFPQGGIQRGESPEQAMFRELFEEIGLVPEHVKIVARTQNWLRYNVPEKYLRPQSFYKGQKQIWYLLQMLGKDHHLSLCVSKHPEFDAWRWNDYWGTVDGVIEFKREVYRQALTELSGFLPKVQARNRYLRASQRSAGSTP